MKFILICLGGAAGTGCRYLIALGTTYFLGSYFPFGTLAVNVLGSFLISFIGVLSLKTAVISPELELILTIGFLGGLTTYSGFNLEILAYLEQGSIFKGIFHCCLMILLCLAAGLLGVFAARATLS